MALGNVRTGSNKAHLDVPELPRAQERVEYVLIPSEVERALLKRTELCVSVLAYLQQ
jgi:hypothetical protein